MPFSSLDHRIYSNEYVSDQGLAVGLSFKQYMVIEFTKALLSREDNNPIVKTDQEQTVSLAIEHANEVIKQLNQE